VRDSIQLKGRRPKPTLSLAALAASQARPRVRHGASSVSPQSPAGNLLARFGGISTTERHISALGRDDKDLLPFGVAILARLLHRSIRCVVAFKEDRVSGADADFVSPRLNLFHGIGRTCGTTRERSCYPKDQPAYRPQSYASASRAEALDVRIALSRKLFDGGVQWVHLLFETRPRNRIEGRLARITKNGVIALTLHALQDIAKRGWIMRQLKIANFVGLHRFISAIGNVARPVVATCAQCSDHRNQDHRTGLHFSLAGPPRA
jgi:hypothetical protein